MSVNKLVLKGTGKMSLHERFTALKFEARTPKQEVISTPVRQTQRQPQRTNVAYSSMGRYEEQYSARPAPVRSRTPDQPRYSARRRSVSPIPRYNRAAPTRTQAVTPNRNIYNLRSPSSTVLAANRIRKRSIKSRLGVRPASAAPAFRVWDDEPFIVRQQSYGIMSRSASMSSLNRWNSQGSLNSYSDVPRYQQNRYGRYQGGRRNFSYNRGRGRRGYGGRGRFGGGRGRGWGRGRGRGGRYRGGNRQQQAAPPTREALDAELDSYMAGTRNLLDRELDTYMADK